MKKFIFSFSILTFLISTAFSGGAACDGNDFFIQGVKSKFGYYSADGTPTGNGASDVTKVYTSGDSTIAVLDQNYTDYKSGKTHPSVLKLACVNGLFITDMSGMLSAMGASHDMKIECTGNMVGYKQSYTVGEKLDSINMVMKMFNNGSLLTTTNVRVYDRLVESYENLTVPEGTYKCYKISYMSLGTTVMNGRTFPAGKATKSVMYYYPKLGMVRMETYGADDKLFSYSQLLELTKP
jgi:hypothetical protein